MSVENVNEAPQEEEIQIQITEDAPEGQEPEGDELERYTKSVSKRINKLNAKTREAEERAQQYEQLLYQQQNELAQYKQMPARPRAGLFFYTLPLDNASSGKAVLNDG